MSELDDWEDLADAAPVEEPLEEDAHGFIVTLPSGTIFKGGLTEDEARYVQDRSARYVEDNHFTNISDMQDVDRLVIMELLVMRWSQFVATGFDNDNVSIDDVELRKSIKDLSGELRQLKKALGVDKQTRDKERGEDAPSSYLNNLRRRAKEFGVKREEELDKALELFQQLKAIVTLYDNCDDVERRETSIGRLEDGTTLQCTTEDILRWVRDIAMPEYDRIDEHFRNRPDGQRYWRGTL